jgi:hypothetical protein
MITSVRSSPTLLHLLFKLFCLIYTTVLLAGTLDVVSYYQLFKNVFTGKTCRNLLCNFVESVWFVSRISLALKNRLVSFNPSNLLNFLFNTLVWILLCNYLFLTVVLMLCLPLLIDFLVWFALFLVAAISLHSRQLIFFLNIGSVGLVYRKRSFLIEIQGSKVCFGNPYLLYLIPV